jgi:hypothetical protein
LRLRPSLLFFVDPVAVFTRFEFISELWMAMSREPQVEDLVVWCRGVGEDKLHNLISLDE